MAKEPRLAKRCKVQKKIRYRSRAQALKTASRAKFSRYKAYECPHCHSWHLTTKYADGKEEI